MLADLERDDEIEASGDLERPTEIVREEPPARDFECTLVDVVAVDPEDVGDAVLEELREPRAGPAADVDDAPRGSQLEHQRHDDLG